MIQAPAISGLWGPPEQRRAFRRYWIRDVLVGAWSVGLLSLLGLLPASVCSGLGAWLGRLSPLISPARDRRLRQTILRLRPDLKPQLDQVMARVWANLGRVAAEYAVLPKLWDAPLPTVQSPQHLDAARATGRPRIFVGVHLGMAEMLGPVLIRMGEDGYDIFQPQPNRFRRGFTERLRKRFEGQLVEAGPGAMLTIRRGMERHGKSLVLFVDEFTRGRVQTPAMGRPVSVHGNLGLAVRLAFATGAVLVPAFVERVKGCQFRLVLMQPIEPRRTLAGELKLRATVTEIDQALERAVMKRLDQWVMLHLMSSEPP